MFYHKECGNIVYGILKLDFLYYAGVGKKSTSIGIGEIIWKFKNEAIEAKYFCPACKKTVEISELSASCQYCGKIKSLEKMFRPLAKRNVPSGGICCEECLEKYIENNENSVSLIKVAEKVWVGEK